MTLWRCGFCGAETEARDRPQDACPQCGDQVWEEVLRDEQGAGDHIRPG